MDPVSMILAMALKNPQATANAVEQYNTPGQVDAAKLQSSAADFAMQTLACYHKSARFRGVDILGAPWRDQNKFGARGSVVMRIDFSGLTGASYQMIVAAMAKDQNYRTFVISETSIIPYNKRCRLEYWTASSEPAA
ncbi:MAG TPA: hypothetical protein VF800_14365 [Telluria sp.]|jgi:hypothetical protein